MQSTTRNKLATAVVGVAMVGAAVSLTAGTFSYVTDSTAISVQGVEAGRLTIGASLDHRINVSNISSGWSDSNTFTVQNAGKVAGKLSLKVTDAGSDSAMLSAVELCGVAGPACVSLGQVEGAGEIPTGITIAAGASHAISFDLRMPDNDDQDDLQDLRANAILSATLQRVPS